MVLLHELIPRKRISQPYTFIVAYGPLRWQPKEHLLCSVLCALPTRQALVPRFMCGTGLPAPRFPRAHGAAAGPKPGHVPRPLATSGLGASPHSAS